MGGSVSKVCRTDQVHPGTYLQANPPTLQAWPQPMYSGALPAPTHVQQQHAGMVVASPPALGAPFSPVPPLYTVPGRTNNPYNRLRYRQESALWRPDAGVAAQEDDTISRQTGHNTALGMQYSAPAPSSAMENMLLGMQQELVKLQSQHNSIQKYHVEQLQVVQGQYDALKNMLHAIGSNQGNASVPLAAPLPNQVPEMRHHTAMQHSNTALQLSELMARIQQMQDALNRANLSCQITTYEALFIIYAKEDRRELAYPGQLRILPGTVQTGSNTLEDVMVRILPLHTDEALRAKVEAALVEEFTISKVSKFMLGYMQAAITHRHIDTLPPDRQGRRLPTSAAANAAVAAVDAEQVMGQLEEEAGAPRQPLVYQIVMQLPAATLASWVDWCQKQPGPLPARFKLQTLNWGGQCLEALVAMHTHAQGITHGCLNPYSIAFPGKPADALQKQWLPTDVRLGLFQMFSPAQGEDESMFRPPQVLGSSDSYWVAPEVEDMSQLSHASDAFSFGRVLAYAYSHGALKHRVEEAQAKGETSAGLHLEILRQPATVPVSDIISSEPAAWAVGTLLAHALLHLDAQAPEMRWDLTTLKLHVLFEVDWSTHNGKLAEANLRDWFMQICSEFKDQGVYKDVDDQVKTYCVQLMGGSNWCFDLDGTVDPSKPNGRGPIFKGIGSTSNPMIAMNYKAAGLAGLKSMLRFLRNNLVHANDSDNKHSRASLLSCMSISEEQVASWTTQDLFFRYSLAKLPYLLPIVHTLRYGIPPAAVEIEWQQDEVDGEDWGEGEDVYLGPISQTPSMVSGYGGAAINGAGSVSAPLPSHHQSASKLLANIASGSRVASAPVYGGSAGSGRGSQGSSRKHNSNRQTPSAPRHFKFSSGQADLWTYIWKQVKASGREGLSAGALGGSIRGANFDAGKVYKKLGVSGLVDFVRRFMAKEVNVTQQPSGQYHFRLLVGSSS